MGKNKPFTGNENTIGNRVTLLSSIARSAEEHRKQSPAENHYHEGSYWAGYRDAMYHLARYIEDNEDYTCVAMIEGLEEYRAWAKLSE